MFKKLWRFQNGNPGNENYRWGGVLPWYVYVAIASMIYDAIKGFSAGAKDAAREASK